MSGRNLIVAKATLLVIQGADQGARFELDEHPVGVGRGARNEIRILDTEVSRRHARIHYEDGVFILTDCNSSNGTYVNGVRIQQRKLRSGDQIQMGRTALLFSTVSDEEESRLGALKNVEIAPAEEPAPPAIVGAVSHDAQQQLLEQSLAVGAPEVAEFAAYLHALYRISEAAVSHSVSIDQFLRTILDITIDVVEADRGCMLIFDPQTEELVPQVYRVRSGVDDQGRMPVSRTIVDYVLSHGQGVRTSDARSDQRFKSGRSILQAGIREAICVPMRGRYEQIGVIYLDTTTPSASTLINGGAGEKFSENKLRLVLAVARQAALAIEDYRFQQALVKAERFSAMGQTIATLSHHIKNILQGVRGGSYLIDMGLKQHNEDLIAKGWSIVEKNQEKIYHLVMDMLTFSKEREPDLQEASVNDTVQDVFELMQPRAEECGVKLECRLSADVPSSLFDPEAIHRAVLNIVINAVEAVEGRDGGCVVIQTGYSPNTDELLVEVRDNGPGIPREQLTRIFNVFESTKGARGTGLGLAVSRKIIREHGGDITVESEPGRGARFLLAWPRLEPEHGPGEHTTLAG
ncbi:MAG: FHA domain-containing protein [Planctomycetes bacterium]|nr:FHA domain-containing protein [Planctomycetota bacterium]